MSSNVWDDYVEMVKRTSKQSGSNSTLVDGLECGLDKATGELSYDGVKGSAVFVAEPRRFWHGKIVGITDLVLFEAETFAELKEEFVAAVDDWRETRAAL